MRILHVISSVDSIGGGPIEGVKRLGQVLEEQGHVLEVASLDAPSALCVSSFPLPVHALGPARFNYCYAPGVVRWLRRYASRFDAVVVNGIWQFHSLAVWRALRHSRTPYFVFTHGMLDPWFKHTFPLKHLKKSLYWPWAEYRVLRDARGVCFTCEEERVLARQSFRRYQCRENVVSYGTASPPGDSHQQREAFFERFPHLRNQPFLLFLGRLHVKKGCDLLIKAFASIAARDPALHLVIAGPDQTGLQAQLQTQATQLGIAERVTWAGMLEGDCKWGAFHSANAFVLPSHQENFGIAVAEALACGVPVLISDKVNIWREIEADGAGFVAPDTLDGTVSLLSSWLDLPEIDKQKMRQSAMRSFSTRFEIHRAAQSLIDVVTTHAAPKPSP